MSMALDLLINVWIISAPSVFVASYWHKFSGRKLQSAFAALVTAMCVISVLDIVGWL